MDWTNEPTESFTVTMTREAFEKGIGNRLNGFYCPLAQALRETFELTEAPADEMPFRVEYRGVYSAEYEETVYNYEDSFSEWLHWFDDLHTREAQQEALEHFEAFEVRMTPR